MNENNNKELAPVLTVGDWIITLIISMIPIVNFIFFIIWGFFTPTVNPNKKNFAKVAFVFLLISYICAFIFSSIIGILFAAVANQ